MVFFNEGGGKKTDDQDVLIKGGAGLIPAFPLSHPSPIALPEDPKEAQKVFNVLPVKNQLDIILAARGKERLRTLFLSEYPINWFGSFPNWKSF